MEKRNKIIYWIATAWLSLGMLSTGVVQIMKMDEEVEMMGRLGYPVYLMPWLGIAKILGVIAILLPRLPILKEWVYAGFFFNMAGAIISHLMSGDAVAEIFPPLLLLALTVVSWYFRPNNRKLFPANL